VDAGPDRWVNGVSQRKARPLYDPAGGKPKAFSGPTKVLTSKDGFSHRRASNPVKNNQWFSSSTVALRAQPRRSGPAHLEWRGPSLPLFHHTVTTSCCRIPAEVMAREKSLPARM